MSTNVIPEIENQASLGLDVEVTRDDSVLRYPLVIQAGVTKEYIDALGYVHHSELGSLAYKSIVTRSELDADVEGHLILDAERTKLAGIEDGATKNSTDEYLLDLANATGNLDADKLVDGANIKAFTVAERDKLAGIASGATKNTGVLADKDTVGTANIDAGAVTWIKLSNDVQNLITGGAGGAGGAGGQLLPIGRSMLARKITVNSDFDIPVTYDPAFNTLTFADASVIGQLRLHAGDCLAFTNYVTNPFTGIAPANPMLPDVVFCRVCFVGDGISAIPQGFRVAPGVSHITQANSLYINFMQSNYAYADRLPVGVTVPSRNQLFQAVSVPTTVNLAQVFGFTEFIGTTPLVMARAFSSNSANDFNIIPNAHPSSAAAYDTVNAASHIRVQTGGDIRLTAGTPLLAQPVNYTVSNLPVLQSTSLGVIELPLYSYGNFKVHDFPVAADYEVLVYC